jgi:hypothetical protein
VRLFQLESFSNLISKVCAYPILQFPDFTKPFILETDASQRQIAAVLMQENHGKKKLFNHI